MKKNIENIEEKPKKRGWIMKILEWLAKGAEKAGKTRGSCPS